MTATPISPAIENACAAVANAAKHLEEAEKALAGARANTDAIGARITALDAQVAAIRTNRSAGLSDDIDNIDAGRIAVINMDREDLLAMKVDADEAVKPHQRAVDAARNALAACQQALEQEKQEELLRRLISYADELAKRLFATAKEIETHKPRKQTTRNLWSPTPEFDNLLHRLALQR